MLNLERKLPPARSVLGQCGGRGHCGIVEGIMEWLTKYFKISIRR